MQETQETWVRFLGWEDSPAGGKGIALQLFLPEKFHGQRSLPGYIQYMRWVLEGLAPLHICRALGIRRT